jgi:hypothetical protein
MITLCCSLKVRKRLGLPDKLPPPKPATTVLGNWYVSLQHFGKLQMILATSEASLLSVVFPARDLRLTLERNLQAGLGGVLLALGVNDEFITREQQEMEEVVYATTTNRSVIGSMNQLGMFLSYELERTADPLSLALRLSDIPMTALKGKGANTHPFPDIVTRERFGLSGRIHLNS